MTFVMSVCKLMFSSFLWVLWEWIQQVLQLSCSYRSFVPTFSYERLLKCATMYRGRPLLKLHHFWHQVPKLRLPSCAMAPKWYCQNAKFRSKQSKNDPEMFPWFPTACITWVVTITAHCFTLDFSLLWEFSVVCWPIHAPPIFLLTKVAVYRHSSH